MATLRQMCKVVAPYSAMTVVELLDYCKGSDSVSAEAALAEITAAYVEISSYPPAPKIPLKAPKVAAPETPKIAKKPLDPIEAKYGEGARVVLKGNFKRPAMFAMDDGGAAFLTDTEGTYLVDKAGDMIAKPDENGNVTKPDEDDEDIIL